jgi:hypothetical protein
LPAGADRVLLLTFEMQGPGPDGKMFKTLEILYTRQ